MTSYAGRILETNPTGANLFEQWGKGTTFEVYFPVENDSLNASIQHAQVGGAMTPGTETLLVFERERALRDLTSECTDRAIAHQSVPPEKCSYFPKPYTQAQLAYQLRTVLDQ